MKKKFDVNKSFDLFWREPFSILTEGLFKLVNIQSNIFGGKPSVKMDATLFDPGIEVDSAFTIPFYDWLVY